MSKTLRGLVVLVGIGAMASSVLAAQAAKRTAKAQAPHQIGGRIKAKPGTHIAAVGTLGYDNDVPNSRFGALTVPVGNNFNTGFADPHSIAQVSFRLAGCFTTPYVGAQAIVADINPTAMTVMNLAQFSAGAGGGVGCNGASVYTGMLPTPAVAQVGPFFGGILNSPFGGCSGNTAVGSTCDGVALSAGTVDPGMGFHGVVVNGGMYTAIAPTKNAIFRATGDNLPVELMGLSVQ
jgi:hypothetical protein